MDDLFNTDPELLALFAEAETFVDTMRANYRAAVSNFAGCDIEHVYAMQAHMLVMAGVRLVAGHQARAASARPLRHDCYSLGLKKAPRRRTRAEQQLDDARAFGLIA
jgi:hypothetical protein